MKTEPPSDHDQHVAPAEPHPIKRTLWQRWMAWSGSFLVISILLHVILLGGATLLVVQVVQGRKEKLKFTAPPPTSNPGSKSVEHQVKMAKKNASLSQPSISKRITSTAANASIALPTMDLNSSTPDVMASVMSGMGGSGLGAGGAAGMPSMPLAGLTAFGFKGKGITGGLVGHFYDLKQTPDRKPTDIKDDGVLKDEKEMNKLPSDYRWGYMARTVADPSKRNLLTDSFKNHARVLNEFFAKSWDENVLKNYYQSKDSLMAYQWFIPNSSPQDALKAFGLEKEVKPTHFLIHYKGAISPPRSGYYRFIGRSSSGLAVQIDKQNVFFDYPFNDIVSRKPFDFIESDLRYNNNTGYSHGKWVYLAQDSKYPMEVLLDGGWGGITAALMIEEKNPPTPYLVRQLQDYLIKNEVHKKHPIKHDPKTDTLRYPIFALKKGLPMEPYVLPSLDAPPDATPTWGPWEKIPEVAPEALIFTGK